MASCGSHGGAGRKHLRVLLPFTHDSLRIPDELASEIDAGEAFVVAPFGKGRVRCVEVGEDGDGAFLGRGWPEFAAACGAGAGWFLVLRHHGGGVLTVKVFDATRCLRELATRPLPATEEPMSNTDASRRPQFISVLAPDSMEKLPIPAKFVQNYISKGHMNNSIAVLLGPLGKICQVELKMNGPDTIFSGGWSQFLALNGITEADCLLLRYERNMTFTVKVFGPNGCKMESKHNGARMQQISTLPDIEKQQELSSACIEKCERKKDRLCSEEQKKPKAPMTSLKASLHKKSFYEIGPPSWIKKVINTSTLEHHLSLAKDFCSAIGLQEPCIITLKTSMDCTESWQVHGRTGTNCSYIIKYGWKRFCLENSLKEGDMCTFYVVETTLWHVVITRCKEKETPSAASSKRKSNTYISSGEEPKGPNGSMISSKKASSNRKCSF
ncbi:unnamed protein product [Urochloa decumbens]|uniref:TF-B3 domain-containing protein n=1 Tax=Urochloa decumbens TaxID=240449 RepID=A0ABC9CZ69_9POAL